MTAPFSNLYCSNVGGLLGVGIARFHYLASELPSEFNKFLLPAKLSSPPQRRGCIVH